MGRHVLKLVPKIQPNFTFRDDQANLCSEAKLIRRCQLSQLITGNGGGAGDDDAWHWQAVTAVTASPSPDHSVS